MNTNPYRMLSVLKLSVAIWACLFSITVSAQSNSFEHLDSVVSEYVNMLRTGQHADTFYIYQEYSIGGHPWINVEDRCDDMIIYIPTYIFWLKAGKTFLTKKDNCFDYATIEVEFDSVWQYMFRNIGVIKTEHQGPFAYVAYKDGRKDTFSVFTDHPGIRNFRILVGADSTEEGINDFSQQQYKQTSEWIKNEQGTYVEQEIKQYNINYERNMALKGKLLADMSSAFVRGLESKKLFVKTRRQ